MHEDQSIVLTPVDCCVDRFRVGQERVPGSQLVKGRHPNRGDREKEVVLC